MQESVVVTEAPTPTFRGAIPRPTGWIAEWRTVPVFGWWVSEEQVGARTIMKAPVWPIVVACVSAVIVCRRGERRARIREHDEARCVACGYEQRGLAPGASCPECGTRPSAAGTGV